MRRLYSLLLQLFPSSYQEEYGDELQVVFDLLVEDAMKLGVLEVVRVVFHELVGLPKAILYEHLREMSSKVTGKFVSRFDFPQGSRMEFWVVLLPFVLTYILYRSTFLLLFLNVSNMPFSLKSLKF